MKTIAIAGGGFAGLWSAMAAAHVLDEAGAIARRPHPSPGSPCGAPTG